MLLFFSKLQGEFQKRLPFSRWNRTLRVTDKALLLRKIVNFLRVFYLKAAESL